MEGDKMVVLPVRVPSKPLVLPLYLGRACGMHCRLVEALRGLHVEGSMRARSLVALSALRTALVKSRLWTAKDAPATSPGVVGKVSVNGGGRGHQEEGKTRRKRLCAQSMW